MAVPDSVTSRVVQGTYVDNAGTPQRGTITFRVDQPLIATVESWGVIPEPIVVTLTTSGTFQATLMATDDLDLFPSGFRYTVQERFNGGYVRTYSIDVPTGGDPLDLPTAAQYDPGDVGLAVVHSINGRTGIVQISAADLSAVPLAQKGAANGVASLDSAGYVPISQLPAGTMGVSSVDGRSGVVTLTDRYSSLDHVHSYPVTSVNGKTGVVALAPADMGAVSAALLGANSGVATLDAGGKLLGAQVPDVALNNVFDVASQTAMLGLSATRGDLARRTDLSKTFILIATDASLLSNWKELITPPDAVSSVNGYAGAITLTAATVGAVSTTAAGAAGGVATLDGSGLVPVAQVPGLSGAKITSGLIDFLRLPTGATSTTVAVGNHAHAYVPTADKGQPSGVASLDSGGRVPLAQLPAGVAAVLSVNGQTGAVTLGAADVGAVAATARGAANGVASLDAGTLVPLAQIPGLTADKITAGTVDIARLPTGTVTGTVALGDHIHDYVPTTLLGAASGVATLDADSLVTFAQMPVGTDASSVALGDHSHAGAYLTPDLVGVAGGLATLDGDALLPSLQIPGLDAAKVTTGVFDIARLPVGTDAVSVAVGNHTHGYIASSEKGTGGGVAPLDDSSKLPTANLTPYVQRSVLLNPDDDVPDDLPVGAMVLRADAVPWTQIVIQGVWDGTSVLPVTIAA